MARSKAFSHVTTIGDYGHDVLALLYRYGGLTRHQLARLTGLSLPAIYRQISHLGKAGMIAIAKDSAEWQPAGRRGGQAYSVYYLKDPAGVKAGGRSVGVEYDRAATRDYRRIRMPSTTAHRVLANEYLLTLREAALASGHEAPIEEQWSESCTHFPLFGAGRPRTKRRDTRYRYEVIEPDGTYVLDRQRFYLELETAVRTQEVTDNLRKYVGRWRRRLAPNAGEVRWHDPAAQIEPVVLITAHTAHAASLQSSLNKRLPEVDGWEEAEAAISAAAGGRVDPRKLILVAGWDEVRDNPLGRVYRPLRKYPADASEEDGWKVGLADAAAVAARITPPTTEEAKQYVEEEAEKEVAS